MTTYTAIPGADIDTDSPITESLMTKLRDNPIAITEGAAGAPKNQAASIATDAIDFSTKVAVDGSTGSWNVSGTAFQVIPRGVYNIVMSAGSAQINYFANSTWTAGNHNITTAIAAQVVGDGTNVRIGGFSGTNTAQFVKLY